MAGGAKKNLLHLYQELNLLLFPFYRRQTLLRFGDAKADARARIIECKIYDACKTLDQWRNEIARHRQEIEMKFQQKIAAAQQQQMANAQYNQSMPPMGYLPPQMQQNQMPQMQHNYQQQQQQPPMMMMQPTTAPYPSQPLPQQQGWGVQNPYGYQMMQQQQLQQQQLQQQQLQQQQAHMQWNMNVTPQSNRSTATTVAPNGWGAAPPANGYHPAPHSTAPVAMAPPGIMPQPQAPQYPNQVQGPSAAEKQKALNEFRRLQLEARGTFLSDAKKVAQLVTKASNVPEQSVKLLLKTIAYIEVSFENFVLFKKFFFPVLEIYLFSFFLSLQLEDLSKLESEITFEQLSTFAGYIENSKRMVAKVMALMHSRQAAAAKAADAATAASQPATQLKNRTEELLQILKKEKVVVFPPAVAACLKNQFETTQQTFPLPKIK
jgi:hypothetical protein